MAGHEPGITVLLGTVNFGGIGFISVRNKFGRNLVNPNFCSADTWSFFRLEALLKPYSSCKFQLILYCFHFRKILFPGRCILGPDQQEIWKKGRSQQTLKYFSKQSGKTLAFAVYFVSLELLNRNKCWLMIQELFCRSSSHTFDALLSIYVCEAFLYVISICNN